MQEVLDAPTANPEIWSKTVLLINFDENDGFFDHLPPPCAPSVNPDGSLAGATTLDAASVAVEYHNYQPATSSQPAKDGRPYGPGPRVPMWIVSPWSRGGWVNSQVHDHTSVLQFLEKRFGVAEPQISDYRRAVCGDLTSCFNFVNPNNETLPTLDGRTTKTAVDARILAQTKAAALAKPTASTTADLPAQATGSRPSRALPYELHVTAKADPVNSSIKLTFVNQSSKNVGAVFHVYDELHLDQIPRRYTVEAGKALAGQWDVRSDSGKYSLWVVGPNGFHRHFTGDLTQQSETTGGPEIQVCYEVCDPARVVLKLHNTGKNTCTFTAKALAYRNDGPWTAEVAPGAVGELEWALGDSGNWYDFAVTCSTQSSFQRRFAGRVENGKDSVSDPAMGMLSNTQ